MEGPERDNRIQKRVYRVSLSHFFVRRAEITTNIYNELLEVRQQRSHPAVWRPPPGSRADIASGQ